MHSCQCEHVAHTEREKRPQPLTPNGNVSHAYGARFHDNYLGGVETPFGVYVVCKDCARDCMAEYTGIIAVAGTIKRTPRQVN